MTDLLDRPLSRTAADAGDRPASLAVAGALAAGWTVVVGLTAVLVSVLVVWASDPRSGSGAVATVRTALQVWLLAHHVPLAVPGGRIAVAPLGLLLVLLLLLARGGRVVARDAGVDDLAGALRVAVAVAAPYTVLTALVTAGATTAAVRPAPVLSLVWGGLVGVTGAGIGAWRVCGARPFEALPARVRATLAAGGAACLLVVAAGAVLGAAALASNADAAGQAMTTLRPGAVGGVALLLTQLGFVPNAALWSAAYVVGPGFAIGAGTSIGPYAVTPGRLPALPMLAAVPARPAGGWVVTGLVVVLLAAAVAAALLVVRGWPQASVAQAATAGVGAGAVAGVLLALLVALAGGSAGPGLLAAFGPSPWRVGLVLALEVGPAAAGFAALFAWRGWFLRP